ncbi:large ribosomal subunit protein mL38-like [Littorina saxatilis]|uniref:Large ribosomal subunit protein mL38 n=1 Tax=Littorina saxatilis TaxID=31220 RepID=A0AAN9GNQ0_9CAEN
MAVTARVACVAARKALLQGRGAIAVQPHRSRHKTIYRGKWPEEARTFQQRLDEINAKDPELDRLVNIGFPVASHADSDVSERKKQREWVKSRGKLEYAARHKELRLDLGEVKAKWLEEVGPHHVRSIAEHYSVYSDLFGTAFFYNTMPMSVCYDYDDEFVTPVYYGNRIPPSEAAVPPFVDYESDPDTLWTLVMSSPDADLQHNDKECLHWLVTNIPGSDVESGETLCDYLQPFPVRGAGYLRYIFLLYKQNKRIDFTSHKRSPNCKSLTERTFSTLDFYRQHQDDITPASVCFFQSQWDSSVKSIFHDVLGMKEPSFEFIRPPNYHPKQKRYPIKQPFNLYLDRYRDAKDIQEEVLKERLKRVDPFSPPASTAAYPNIYRLPHSVPTWMRLRIKNMRLGKHQWKDMNPDP